MNKQSNKLTWPLLLIFISTMLRCNESAIQPATPNGAGEHVSLQLINDQIPSPLALGSPADGSNRLFICQKEGKVWIVKNGTLLTQPFLDVSNQLVAA